MRCEGSVGEYKIVERIGAGAYGLVCKAIVEGDSKEYAIKQMKLFNKDGIMDAPLIEATALQSLDHPNIIKPLGFRLKNDTLYMITPYGGPSLDKRILGSNVVKRVMYQLFLAAHHMELNHIIHRDIKPANIVLAGGSSRPIIVDFGIASIKGVGTDYTNVVTLWWRTPELFTPITYDNRIDVWSLGVVMYNILTGLYLWTGRKPEEYLSNVLSSYSNGREWYELRKDDIDMDDINIQDGPLLPEILYDHCITDEESSFIQYILQLDYDDIPTAMDCLNHKYFDDTRTPVVEVLVHQPYPYPMIIPYSNKIRVILTDWILEVANLFKASNLTYYTSIMLFDRVQKKIMNGDIGSHRPRGSTIVAGQRIPKEELQIMGYACFYLAMTTTHSHVLDEESIARYLPSDMKRNLKHYAIFVCDILNYNISCYTPYLYSAQYKKSLIDGSVLSEQ